MNDDLIVLRIAARPWPEVQAYLYGQPFVNWDTLKNAPRIVDDEVLGAAYEVAVERHWVNAGQLNRLSSGLIGVRRLDEELVLTEAMT